MVHKYRWEAVPEEVVAIARENIIAGMTIKAVSETTGVSTATVKRIKADLGLTRYRTHVSNDLMATIRDAVSIGMSYAEIKAQFHVSSSFIADVKRDMGLLPPVLEQQPPQAPPAEDTAPTPPAPDTRPEPGAYFEAIRDGILKGHAREQALEEHITVLQSRIATLEAKNRELYDAMTQIRAQMSSWAGPAPIPNRNLSTGG